MAWGEYSVKGQFAGFYTNKNGEPRERPSKIVDEINGETLRIKKNISDIINLPETEIDKLMLLGLPYWTTQNKLELFLLSQVLAWIAKHPKI